MRLLLKGVPVFAGVEEAAIDLLLEESKRDLYPAGAVIVREGENGNCMYLIESGTVRIVKNLGREDECEITRFGGGEFFGETCILEPYPRSSTAQTVTASTLIGISSFAFHHLYQRMPAQHSILLLNIARDLCRRLRRIDETFAAKH